MPFFTRLFDMLSRKKTGGVVAPVFFSNTLSGVKERFISAKPGVVTMYSCGPTAYGPAHIGNLRASWLPDLVARTLQDAGYHVRTVINITDFGHLVTDGDAGEDKMTKGLKREGLTLTLENMRILAEKYAVSFINDLKALDVQTGDITFPRASDYIPEQIALIKTLEQKGYAYRTADGVYFDTARFVGYGKLGGIEVDKQQEGTRVKQSSGKHHPADFVLWKPDAHLGWKSPWGLGFPGWHIECSAMIHALLGQEIDIHMGGEDLKAVHHNNEIAQSESASGRTFVHYWLHNAFVTAANGEKASKSLGNIVYLSDIAEHGLHPLALRYFFLQAHYRTPLSFSWAALEASDGALTRLWRLANEIAGESKRRGAPSEALDRFVIFMRDDLGTPQALGVLWEALKSEEYTWEQKWALIERADAILGLSLTQPPEETAGLSESDVPAEVRELLHKREEARRAKDFKTADVIRGEIEKSGYRVEDGPSGAVLTKLIR